MTNGLVIGNPLYQVRPPMGELELTIAPRAGKSVAIHQYHRGSMKVMRPHYLDDTGQAYYTLLIPGGGYLGGDDYTMKIHVAEGGSLLLTGQSATKVYRTPDDYCLQVMDITMEKDSIFEYIPDQLILYRDSSYRQFMNVDIDASASFLTAEIITPGWDPHGGQFLYDEARLRTELRINGELQAIDNLVVHPKGAIFAADQLVITEKYSHVGTILAYDAKITDEMVKHIRDMVENYESRTEVIASVSRTNGGAVAMRALGTMTEDIYALIIKVADYLRGELRGQKPLALRKY
ncbi:urease accessory protein UreD [Corynebacterium caspium]|uniref:urease accessory protein UreD n=1 Tax=Corynebacterium caspium TaxID=234828 RepID=UPI00037A188B|nr:urease accessory protein UreD [Corynebacterium caspium]WKD58627.1 Urease accessory protein UreD [Corynebacterium caspium DSM 44850]